MASGVEAVLDYLKDAGYDISQMEVRHISGRLCGRIIWKRLHTVKNNVESKRPFITSYVILHINELYDAGSDAWVQAYRHMNDRMENGRMTQA